MSTPNDPLGQYSKPIPEAKQATVDEEMDKLRHSTFVQHCDERHCFFYSAQFRNCLFRGLTIIQLQAYCRMKGISIDMVMNSTTCPPPTKAIVNNYKMGKLLFGAKT